MAATATQDVLYYLKLLANETRLKLLGLIADGERSVGELAEILELSEPTISHHLAKLADAELVTMRADGNVHSYRLNGDVLHRLSRDFFTPEKVVSFAGAADAAGWERKVLGTYLDGERLTKIPDVRKKRDVVLRWLAERFERDRRYSEIEVNEVIRPHHPDVATLRRELVGARLMQRENGIYWRPAAAA
ncbi:MAG TPA: metalloregulator ArsR/SmtB family transcription factor [Longimicrobiaceae bacterium]